MRNDRYVPDPPSEGQVLNAWIGTLADVGPGSYDSDVADFRAFIAGIRAGAIGAAADVLELTPPSLNIWGKPRPGRREAIRRLREIASEFADKPEQEDA